jgi:hypothetical protein
MGLVTDEDSEPQHVDPLARAFDVVNKLKL